MPAMTPQLDDLVVLLVDLPELNLHCGDFGRVCGYHTAPTPMYEVEFQTALNGHVVHALLPPEQIQVVPPQEMDTLGEAYLSI